MDNAHRKIAPNVTGAPSLARDALARNFSGGAGPSMAFACGPDHSFLDHSFALSPSHRYCTDPTNSSRLVTRDGGP